MGIKPEISLPAAKPRIGMANALFSATQQRVLALLFEHPERSFYATEIIALAGSGSGAVQRELKRLAESGLLTVTRVGNQKHYQADQASPIYAELSGIIGKTVGVAQPLREVLLGFAAQIRVAFIYSSAIRRGDETGAIDLIVIGHRLSQAEVSRDLKIAERQLDRAVTLTLYTPQEWAGKRKDKSPATNSRERHKIFLIGAEDDMP